MCRSRERHVKGGKSKRVVKKGKVSKPPGRLTSHSTKRGKTKMAEKSSNKVRQSKGGSEKMNEDMETSEATISHLKPDKTREKVELPPHTHLYMYMYVWNFGAPIYSIHYWRYISIIRGSISSLCLLLFM